MADQARNARADLMILPAPGHLSPLELNAVMDVADVETRGTPTQLRPLGIREGGPMSAPVAVGFAIAIGLPLLVIAAIIWWP